MKTGNDDKKSRLEFTEKFIESIKPTEKEDRYTDVKIPGLTGTTEDIVKVCGYVGLFKSRKLGGLLSQ